MHSLVVVNSIKFLTDEYSVFQSCWIAKTDKLMGYLLVTLGTEFFLLTMFQYIHIQVGSVAECGACDMNMVPINEVEQ